MAESLNGIYDFTVTLADVEDVTERITGELIDAGCGDGSTSSCEGVVSISFRRKAVSLDSAIESATEDLERAGFCVLHVGDESVFDHRDWLKIMFASMGDGVITADRNGRVNYLNPVAVRLTGWNLADASGMNIEDVFRIIDETTREPIAQPVRKVIERGLAVGLANHTLLIDRSGAERPIDDSAASIKDDQGQIVGIVLIFRDITGRRKAEIAVDHAKEYAESIVATAREPLLVIDAELHVKSANRSFYEMFQVTPDETEGRFIYSLGDGQWNIPALKQLLEEILPQNPSFDNFEVAHDFERIGRRTMLLNARRFPPTGRFELILLAIEDVTERRAIEYALREAERRKDEFIAVLSHELRNPISAIGTAADILKISDSEENRSCCLDVVSHQVKNLESLIEGLLDVSRITQGKVHLLKLPIDLASAITRSIQSVATLMQEQRHELTVSLPEEAMMMEGDFTRLEQVFGNLLTNAAKFTLPGGRIAIVAEGKEGEFIVQVRDNGEGISPEMLPKLFEMFTQVKTSRGHSRGGLGIGLSLVKNLVDLHGGAVEARSEGPGRGSEFIVRLPALIL